MNQPLPDVRFEPSIALKFGAFACLIYCAGYFLLYPLLGFEYDFVLLNNDADSNLRLAQIRAFLDGQDWFDLELKRYGLIGGTPMHWTRVADIIPSGLIVALSYVFPRSLAEKTTLILYPALLLIPYFVALIWAAKRLLQHSSTLVVGIVVVLAALQTSAHFGSFWPGMLDHHNLQQIAALIMVGGMAGKRSLKSGLISACGLVGGLTIGLDSVPALLAIIFALGLLWMFDPKSEAAFIKGLGIGIVTLTPLLGFAFIPRPATAQWCDSWTLPLSAVVFGFGLYLIFVAWLSGRFVQAWPRISVAALVGGITLGALLWFNPACLNPLPLPKDNILVDRYWWSYVYEANSLAKAFPRNHNLLGTYCVGVLAFVIYGLMLRRNPDWMRPSVLVAAGCLGAFVLSIQHVRGLWLFTTLLVPLVASFMILSLNALKTKSLLYRVLPFLMPGFLMTVVNTTIVVAEPIFLKTPASTKPVVAASGKPNDRYSGCYGQAEFDALNKIKPSRIFTSFGPNEFLLALTHHHTMFGGYHRNIDENIEILNWLIATPDVARERILARNIEYFEVCPINGQFELIAEDYPNSFVAQVLNGHPPSWLVPAVPLRGGMVYKVVRSSNAAASGQAVQPNRNAQSK